MTTFSKTKLLAVLSVNVLLFQNCAPAEFEKVVEAPSAVAVSTTNPPPIMLPPTTQIEEALSACDQLQNPKMHVDDIPVFFDNPLNEVGSTPVCSWNKNGNIGVNNGYITARYEQNRPIAIPAGATLCNVDFEFVTQAMKYDDDFFFLVNGLIVATNNDYWQTNYLSHQPLAIGGGQVLDTSSFAWSPLVGHGNATRANLAAGKDFCLGSKEGLSSCSWPVTEIAGKISMSIAPKIVTALGLASAGGGLDVAFVTSGDDDITKDCQHEPLSMRLKVRYIAP